MQLLVVVASVPRQWSDALYSVSELQPKYVPAAAQSALELSMGRLSAMIINNPCADWLLSGRGRCCMLVSQSVSLPCSKLVSAFAGLMFCNIFVNIIDDPLVNVKTEQPQSVCSAYPRGAGQWSVSACW